MEDHANMNLPEMLAAARGDIPCDLVITQARVVNVLSAEIEEATVAVHGGLVVGIGEYTGRETVEAGGRYLAPGFIDAHIHVESTLLTLPNSRARSCRADRPPW